MFDYRDATFDNGLRVITLEDFSAPIVSVQLWYHVGSKDENPERQGFAHMFEHMMFRGTDRLGPTDHFDYIRQTGGMTNAYTSFDQTVYHQIVPANQLEMVLWLEAERMSFLKIDQTAFDTERKVVEEERRLGKNQPFGTVFEQVLALLYDKHPYRWSPIGNIPHLRAAAVKELRDFWTRYYVPNNATLVIAGAVQHDRAKTLAKQYFGWIPRYDDPPRVSVRDPLPTEARTVTLEEKNAPAIMLGIVFRTPPMNHDDAVPLHLLSTILVGGQSSRLYRELVADKQLAMQLMPIGAPLEQDGVLAIGAILSPFSKDRQAVLDLIDAQLERLKAEPVTEAELNKAKSQMLKRIVTGNLTIDSKASLLGQAAVLEHDLARVNRRLDAIRDVSPSDIQRVAATYLNPDRALRGIVEPKASINLFGGDPKKKTEDVDEEESAPITAKPETDPPPPGRPGLQRPKTFAAAPPMAEAEAMAPEMTFDSATLDNGLKVIVVPNNEVPFVSIRLGLLSGAWTEAKPGTAAMTLDMLTKGTKSHTEGALAETLEANAISLNGNAGMDTSAITANCLTDHVDQTMSLLAEVVLTPTFPADELEKLRKQTQTGLRVSSKEPSYLAERQLRRIRYDEHPYARTATGEIEDLDAIQVADLKQWWATFARPDLAVLIFSGDVDKAKALKLAKTHLAGWKADGPKPKVSLPSIPAPAETHIYLVDHPIATQCQIRISQPGIMRDDPAYATTRVVSGYFGGAFNARLNETIRVKKGLTYGARGGYEARRFAADFTLSTFSKTETTAEAVAVMFEELDRLKSQPATAEELAETKSYVIGSWARTHETPQQTAGDLWLIESQNLPADYFTKVINGIVAATADDCAKLIARSVDPKHCVVVVVGPAEKIKADLEKIAPVTVVSQNTPTG
jgi:zinc protease